MPPLHPLEAIRRLFLAALHDAATCGPHETRQTDGRTDSQTGGPMDVAIDRLTDERTDRRTDACVKEPVRAKRGVGGLSSTGKNPFITPTETNVHEDALCIMVKGPSPLQKLRLAVGGGWWSAGGWWRLAAFGSWRLVAVGGGWRLAAVGGRRLVVLEGCPEGLSFTKKKPGFLKTALGGEGVAIQYDKRAQTDMVKSQEAGGLAPRDNIRDWVAVSLTKSK